MSWLFGHIEKRLRKIYDVTTWERNNFNTHILSNISRRKDNQTVKFGQFIEYIIRNIFLKNHTQNKVGKLFKDTFSENQNSTISIYLTFQTVFFVVYSSWALSKYIETKQQTTFYCLIESFSKKQKVIWNSFLCRIFCIILEENICLVIFY